MFESITKPKVREMRCEQWVPAPLEDVFRFFSNPANLELVTPPWVGFKILTPLPIEMKVGAQIEYAIRVHGLPLRWRSEITEWDPPSHFTDVQLRGPYSQWTHRHSFAEQEGGTLVVDHLRYAVPLSWVPGEWIIERFVVRPELERIFKHRQSVLFREFGG
jgi:hypothetical protein